MSLKVKEINTRPVTWKEFQDYKCCQDATTSIFSVTFNATTSWVAGVGIYTYTVLAATHGMGVGAVTSDVQEDTGTEYQISKIAQLDHVKATGAVVVTVPDVPGRTICWTFGNYW